MYRPRSTDVWFNMGGVVAAYQSIAAPDPFAAQQNVSNDARRAGVYALTETTTRPPWSGANGWTFTAAAYNALSTGFVMPNENNWTFAIQTYHPTGWNTWAGMFGNRGDSYQILSFVSVSGYGVGYYYGAGVDTKKAPSLSAGAHHLAMTRYTYWRDGKSDGGPSINYGYNSTSVPMWIGGANHASIPETSTGTIRAFAMYRRTLAPAEIVTLARQMAYCHVNPDWSVWSPRRRWFYGPQVAAAAYARRVPDAGRVGSRRVAE